MTSECCTDFNGDSSTRGEGLRAAQQRRGQKRVPVEQEQYARTRDGSPPYARHLCAERDDVLVDAQDYKYLSQRTIEVKGLCDAPITAIVK